MLIYIYIVFNVYILYPTDGMRHSDVSAAPFLQSLQSSISLSLFAITSVEPGQSSKTGRCTWMYLVATVRYPVFDISPRYIYYLPGL